MPSSSPSELVAIAEALDNDEERRRFAEKLSVPDLTALVFDWRSRARPEQLPPDGDWTTWLIMGGRGSGKTRAGAEWIRELAGTGLSPLALVGETMSEAIEIMVRGESGILRVTPPDDRPRLKGHALLWPNGVEATILGASDPERFRGPQFCAAWCDEIGKWPHAEMAWDMLQFGLRLGTRPRQLATTTPRATRLLKRLLADPQTVTTRMRTDANRKHLAESFLGAVVARYRNSVLGRQELDGELIEDRDDALWRRDMFAPSPAGQPERIVVAVDPPATSTAQSDACGIVVAGRVGEGAVVLEDATLKRAAPIVWARRAVSAFIAWDADALVVEVNQGGEMAKAVIAQVDPAVPVRMVRATRGKWVRAEPVAALYARGLVRHRPGLTALEDELCAFGSDGMAEGHSPDRVDALVWALTELMLNATQPRLRQL